MVVLQIVPCKYSLTLYFLSEIKSLKNYYKKLKIFLLR